MTNSISIISEWKEEVMIGRIEKDFTEDESTKQIYQTENYKIVSYPAIVNGKCNGRLRVELQHNDKNDVLYELELLSLTCKHLARAELKEMDRISDGRNWR